MPSLPGCTPGSWSHLFLPSMPQKQYIGAFQMVVDFVSGYNDYGILDGTLDFVADRAKMRMNHGYEVAKQLIEQLINEGVLAVTLRQKIRAFFINRKKRNENRKNYYNLSKEVIRHRPE